jgi:hypothetical protein
LLNQVFEGVETANAQTLSSMSLIDAASDGWRKKYCAKGCALKNFCALMPDKSLMFDVLNVACERKNAEGIAEILEGMARKMTSGNPDKLVGWVMNNTKANWAAMRMLQEKFPVWIMRGCLAHGLNALMKDICRFKKGQGAKAKDNTWGLQWADTVVMLCNKISNFIQDSTTAEGMVHEAQEAIYGKRRAIEVHAPTRWASNFKVVKSVWRSKGALQQAVRTEKLSTVLESPKPQQASCQMQFRTPTKCLARLQSTFGRRWTFSWSSSRQLLMLYTKLKLICL